MHKFANHYKEASIFDLNMMHVHEYRRSRFSMTEVVVAALPLLALVLVFGATFLPELTFFADCRNIANGDVCRITFG